jgi:hypothetical protein
MPNSARFFEFRPPLATGILLGLLLAGAGLVPLPASQLQAQVVVEERPPAVPVAEALELLASGRYAGRGGMVIRAAFHDEPLPRATHPGNRDAYTGAERRQMLQAVEQAFLGRVGRDAEARRQAQMQADLFLHFLVWNIHQMAPEAREVPRIALRLFHQAEDVAVRSNALSLLAAILPLGPPEAEEIREVFKDAIRGRYDKTLPSISFRHLLKACDAGLAIIEELDREGVRLEGAWHGWIPHVVEQGVSEETYLKWLGQLPDCPPPGTRWPGGG